MRPPRALAALWTALLDTLFPPLCPGCRAAVAAQGAWCPACYRRVVAVRAAPLAPEAARSLSGVLLLCYYRGGARRLLGALKYRGDARSLPPLRFILDRALDLAALRRFDAVVPVPLHAARLRDRGFNQTEAIFRPWTQRHQLEWLDALERSKETAPQYALDVRQRRANLRGAFRVRPDADLRGRRILLLDDIFTTGATMSACAAALRRAGAAEVRGLALAGDA